MSQYEIVKALKNLGNKSFLPELLDEYYKVHWPNKDVYQDQMKDKNYLYLKNALMIYICKTARAGLLKRRRVHIPNTDPTKVSRGRNKVEYYLTSEGENINQNDY